jgi:peptidoglycan/LPS O-acetylase OafA/YrhL
MILEDVLIPLGVFLAIVAIVALITAVIGHWISNKTVREALRSSPEHLALVTAKLLQRRRWRPEAWGLMGIALGAALAVAGVIGAPEARIALFQAALIPGFAGLALIGQRWLPRTDDQLMIGDGSRE